MTESRLQKIRKPACGEVVDEMDVVALISVLASEAGGDAAGAEEEAQLLEMKAGFLKCPTTSSDLSEQVVVSSLLETTVAAPIDLHTGLDMLEPGGGGL